MRLAVLKSYKLYIGGQFPRSESDHCYPVRAGRSKEGAVLAQVPRGTRKDVRDAVVAARAAQPGWNKLTPIHRGQILYRCAEVLECRAAELTSELTRMGVAARAARAEVAAAADLFAHYAGWTDKLGAVLSAVNPIAGPYFNFSAPEPIGVVGVAAPEHPPLFGLVERVLPVVASGNTAVALVSERHPLAALTLGEVLQNGDLPAGVVNLIAGPKLSLVEGLAAHLDVGAIDLTGVEDAAVRTAAARAAAENVKRTVTEAPATSLAALAGFVECKTIWHPRAY